jgi:hypothetical protein
VTCILWYVSVCGLGVECIYVKSESLYRICHGLQLEIYLQSLIASRQIRTATHQFILVTCLHGSSYTHRTSNGAFYLSSLHKLRRLHYLGHIAPLLLCECDNFDHTCESRFPSEQPLLESFPLFPLKLARRGSVHVKMLRCLGEFAGDKTGSNG